MTSHKIAQDLEQKLRDRSAVIGVIGLGYVGLPLAIEFARKGYDTIGIDLDARKIEALQSGKNYIQDISDEHVAEMVKTGKFRAQQNYKAWASST